RETLTHGLAADHEWHWRAFGTFVQPNLFASCLLFALPVALLFSIWARGVTAIIPALLALLMLSELFFTGSRGAVYGLPVAVAVSFIVPVWRGILRGRSRWARLALLAALAVPLAAASTPSLRARAVLRSDTSGPLELLCPAERTGGTGESNAFRRLTWQ